MNLYEKTINRKIQNNTKFREGRKKAMMGENNPRWNGGNSYYPNHADFKRVRIEVLKRTKGKCEICGKSAQLVHHIDGKRDNHELSNLMAVCRKCHDALHYEDAGGNFIKGRPSKYKLLYGKSIKEIAILFGTSTTTIYSWCQNPTKENWMKEQLKQERQEAVC